MKNSYFFYDLETSGLNPRADRIMQFAGVRTDKDFNQLDEPVNEMVAMTNDTLPSPAALMTTGITPQKTVEMGYKESDFAHFLYNSVFTDGTIAIGYNNISFDDEFLRYFFWRNFLDPYKWHYANNRSRWDLLDVVRMTRALRPDGINWPVVNNKPTNKLSLLTSANNINHEHAHDALSDVYALIGVTKLVKQQQSDLFDYLFYIKDKSQANKIIDLVDHQPFVYTCGRYSSEFNKTTVILPICQTDRGAIIGYDLRTSPDNFIKLDQIMFEKSLLSNRLPFIKIRTNQSPAVAPISVLERADGWNRIKLTKSEIMSNIAKIKESTNFKNVFDKKIAETIDLINDVNNPEANLYSGFLGNDDTRLVNEISKLNGVELKTSHPNFIDDRLAPLLNHYKARNFSESLNESEKNTWEDWRLNHLKQQLFTFNHDFETIDRSRLNKEQLFVLSELQLWCSSLV